MNDKKQGITRREIREQIAFASQVVGRWPAWKRNILLHSSQPTNSTTRTPVNNDSSN